MQTDIFDNRPKADTKPSKAAAPTVADEQTVQQKQQRPTTKQRKLDFADYKELFLTGRKLGKRHQVTVSEETYLKLERYSRILGDRDTTVSSYADAIFGNHFDTYADDLEAWRKL